MNWIYLAYGFGVLIFLRFAINLSKFLRIKFLYKKYVEYLGTEDVRLLGYKKEITDLFNEAGVNDSMVIHQEFLGFGNFVNMKISVHSNLANRREDIVGIVNSHFFEAMGVYHKKFLDAINPLFWLEFICKLPQYIFEYFGVLPEKIVVKIALVIYWIAAFFLGLNQLNIIDFLHLLERG